MLPVVAGALLVVAAIQVPVVGAAVAVGLIVAGAYAYQAAAGDAGASSHTFSPLTGLEQFDDREPSTSERVRRVALAVAGAAAFLAPFVVRNGGHFLAGEPPRDSGSFRWMMAALLGWAVVPLVLAGCNARLRRGPVPARFALKTFARHPLAVALALAIAPAGFLAIEGFTAALAAEQGTFAALRRRPVPPPAVVVDGTIAAPLRPRRAHPPDGLLPHVFRGP